MRVHRGRRDSKGPRHNTQRATGRAQGRTLDPQATHPRVDVSAGQSPTAGPPHSSLPHPTPPPAIRMKRNPGAPPATLSPTHPLTPPPLHSPTSHEDEESQERPQRPGQRPCAVLGRDIDAEDHWLTMGRRQGRAGASRQRAAAAGRLAAAWRGRWGGSGRSTLFAVTSHQFSASRASSPLITAPRGKHGEHGPFEARDPRPQRGLGSPL